MRILLDTHAFLWWLGGDRRLSGAARAAIADPGHHVLVSAASAWEITTRHRLGRLPHASVVAAGVARQVLAAGFTELPVTFAHAQHAGSLPYAHKDPFDRMLIAQALIEAMPLVSNEAVFEAFGVTRLW